jgi:hypothetical protein
MRHITRLLLELGAGFAFVARQHRIEVEEQARGGVCSVGNRQMDGVAEYELVRALPEPLDTELPTIAQLEEELSACRERTASSRDGREAKERLKPSK